MAAERVSDAGFEAFFRRHLFPAGGAATGQPGFLELLRANPSVWETRQGDVIESAEKIHARLEEASAGGRETDALLTPNTLRKAAALLKETYDPRHGGFGDAPKFPQPSQPQFLLRYAKRFNDAKPCAWSCTRATAWRRAASTTSSAAALPAIPWTPNGWCRISRRCSMTTPSWRSCIWTPPGQRRGPRYAAVARDILAYVLRDMTHPEGGFYSAEDADSEGHEGKFYCWTRAELAELADAGGIRSGGRVASASPSRATSWTTAIRTRCRAKTS